jgi:hypothetical protein
MACKPECNEKNMAQLPSRIVIAIWPAALMRAMVLLGKSAVVLVHAEKEISLPGKNFLPHQARDTVNQLGQYPGSR